MLPCACPRENQYILPADLGISGNEDAPGENTQTTPISQPKRPISTACSVVAAESWHRAQPDTATTQQNLLDRATRPIHDAATSLQVQADHKLTGEVSVAPLDILNAFRTCSYGMTSAAPKGDISLSYSLHRTHLILVCKEHAGLGFFPNPVILRGGDTMKIVKPGHVEARETARLQSRLIMHGFDPPGTCT